MDSGTSPGPSGSPARLALGAGRERHWLLDGNTASDADEDFALALVFAAHRWHDPRYSSAAVTILGDIWRLEVGQARGTYYLTAGNWATQYDAGLVVNPSYFAPYAYRIFAGEDLAHPWEALADSSYRTVRACSWARLTERRSSGLPPNWCVLRRQDGVAAPFTAVGADDYGYDAFRVMWRVAVVVQRELYSGLAGVVSFRRRVWARAGLSAFASRSPACVPT